MKKDPDIQSKLLQKVRALPNKPGVYLMKDRLGKVIYVGKANSLKKRVSSYFQNSRKLSWQQPKIAAMIDLIFDVDHIVVKSETEALLLEGKVIKQYKPKYNSAFTDDKRFPMIKVDIQSDFPRFKVCRMYTDEKSKYFGPFVHGRHIRKALAELKRQYGILLTDAPEPSTLPDRPGWFQIYKDVRSEIYGHPNELTIDHYKKRVDDACLFLEGKQREWLADLEAQMKKYALEQKFEKAAELRDIVEALKRTVHPKKLFKKDILLRRPLEENLLSQLQEILELPAPPRVIECFDISHISGTFVVASMVYFKDGHADKSQYRRFKIRSFVGNDDFRAMEEVVGRRYRRLLQDKIPFPDLVVIDGGRGQLTAALNAFDTLGIPPPPLVGLAKKEELLILPDRLDEIRLDHSHPALQFVQRIRDEAHRFANTFNADLRSKKIKESVLDEMKGLGEKRKELLINHFKSIQSLRSATAEEIAEVPGIGPLMSQKIRKFLDDH